MQLYKGLFVFEIYSLLAAFQWPPGKSGFQVAGCIAVYSNTFLYNMKANRDLKKYFWWKTTRWFFFGVLSCFRGTATYTNAIIHVWCDVKSMKKWLSSICERPKNRFSSACKCVQMDVGRAAPRISADPWWPVPGSQRVNRERLYAWSLDTKYYKY